MIIYPFTVRIAGDIISDDDVNSTTANGSHLDLNPTLRDHFYLDPRFGGENIIFVIVYTHIRLLLSIVGEAQES